MTINIQSTAQIVSGYAAAVQANAKAAISFVQGSLERARANAVASITMWLQSLAMQILALTRASTSTGTDLDSWMADFDIVTREAAISAIGSVTFARYTPTNQAVIPAGTVIQTADGTQQFTVIADNSQPAWNASQNAYIIAAGTSSISATVEAVTPGTGGNINAGTLTQIASAINGVDTVTNPSSFSSGVDAELDPALLARFQLSLQGLRSAIKASAQAAIEALQMGVQFSIVENETLAGASQPGFFYVVISPYTSQISSAVYSALDGIRGLGISFAVYAATTLTADVSVTITAASGYTLSQVETAVQAAIESYIAAIPLGSGLSWSALYSVIWGVPGVASASALTLNGGSADLAGSPNQAIVAGTVTVS